MKRIVVVAHKYLPHPDDDFVYYLRRRKTEDVLHIRHSFSESQDRKSYYTHYKKGKVFREKGSIDYKSFPEILIYVKEMFLTVFWAGKRGSKWDLYVGMDGMAVLFGIVMKRLGICRKVVFWSVDLVPDGRFDKEWKNRVYATVNRFSYNKADELWDLSPRMEEARRKLLGIEPNTKQIERVVPYGLWLERIKTVEYGKCEKRTLVFMGHLMPKQGVEIVIEHIAEIVKTVPDFRFKIIGGGKHGSELVKIVKKLGVEKYCSFLGRIENSSAMEREVASAAVAVAPYQRKLDKYTYYADPGKVKTYLACGVPVLVTDVPWNAHEIEKRGCGMIIADDGSDLKEKLSKILQPSVNERLRKAARGYAKEFDYRSIFEDLGIV